MVPMSSRQEVPTPDKLTPEVRAEVLEMGDTLRRTSQEVLDTGKSGPALKLVESLKERLSDTDSMEAAWIIMQSLQHEGDSGTDETQTDRVATEFGIVSLAAGLRRLEDHYAENTRA